MIVPAEIYVLIENQKIMIYRQTYRTHDGCSVHLYFEKVNTPRERLNPSEIDPFLILNLEIIDINLGS